VHTVIQIIGGLLFVVGIALIYLPAGIIVAGALLFALGVLLEARMSARAVPVVESDAEGS
jgi:hypothetical protein